MRVTIVGTGYVGLTTGVCLASLGHRVTCVDIVPERVGMINSGEPPFYEPGLAERLCGVLSSGLFHASTELAEAVVNSDVTLITVGTPAADQGIDLSYVAVAVQQIGVALRAVSGYHVVAVKSTVTPGTTDTMVRSILEESSGRRAGEFGLCVNPEFLREGSAIADFLNPDRIVIGQLDEQSGRLLARLYERFNCPKIFTTLRNAEMIKYASNALLATLISFSNEIATFCENIPGTDVEVVMHGVHLDRRLSPVINGERISPEIIAFLRGGCGFGGACLPKDVNALRAYARELGIVPHVLDAVIAVNASRPGQLVTLAEQVLGSVRDAIIAVLGVAFKPGTSDVRESPAVKVIDLLLSKGATVKAYDPVAALPVGVFAPDRRVLLCNAPEEAFDGADAALLVTAWPELLKRDWRALCARMRRQVVIDGRNALRHVTWPANITYLSIGRVPGNQQSERSQWR